MRGIAAEAQANLALINRYFGSKRELFAVILAEQGRFPAVFDEGDEMARSLAEYVADRLTSDFDSLLVATVTRSASSAEIHELVRDRVQHAMLEPLRERLDGEDAELRATLATALISGSAQIRNLFGPLSPLPRQVVVDRLTAVFRACLS